jgi:hypothetical protein
MILLLMGNKYIIGPEWPRINLPAWFRCVRETDGSARWLVAWRKVLIPTHKPTHIDTLLPYIISALRASSKQRDSLQQ